MDKKEIAQIFEEMALFLELKGENPFRIRAYKNAAHTLLGIEKRLEELVEEGTLTEYEGIGAHMAEKITELVQTGRLAAYEKLKKKTPPALLKLMEVPGLGAKKIKKITQKFKVASVAELKKLCEQGKIAKIAGFGKKTEENILNAITHLETYSRRYLWWKGAKIAEPLLQELKKIKGVKKAEIAGSLRRKMETIGDLDFVAAATDPKPAMKWFISHPSVERILAKGETKSSVRLKSGMQADLRIVAPEEFGFALCYFTGSKEHNIKLRERAHARGWKLSEWGMEANDKKHPIPTILRKKEVTEEEIYKALDFSYIPPELRENRGEFAAAEKGKIPKLVEEKDIRGTFHNHTTASDGRNTLAEMVAAAEKLGWEYIGIADHSKSSFQANGQDETRLAKQIEQIKKLNKAKKFRTHIFAGVECDILKDGTLDFPDEVLKELDYVVASLHGSLQQDEKTMTARLIRAIENPYVTMLGHLTSRVLLRREGCAMNVYKIIDACIANGTIIELNANPERLDMDWRLWHAASQKGLLCCINTDAHSTEGLQLVRAGINVARKGWLEKKHILNTRPLSQIQKFLK